MQITMEQQVYALEVGMVILIFALLFLGMRIRKWRKTYLKLTQGVNGGNLEEQFLNLQQKVQQLTDAKVQHQEWIDSLGQKITHLKSHVALKRYNPYGEQGNDLSFSLAIIDEYQTGIVISALHNRDSSYIYAKPIEEGKSKYSLTPEELEVIAQALNQKIAQK